MHPCRRTWRSSCSFFVSSCLWFPGVLLLGASLVRLVLSPPRIVFFGDGWIDGVPRSSNWRILDFFSSSFFGYLFFFFYKYREYAGAFFCISFFLFSFFTSTHREIDVFSFFFFFFTRTRVCWFVFATLLWLVSCMEFTKDLNLLLIKFTLIFKKMGYFQYIIFRIV